MYKEFEVRAKHLAKSGQLFRVVRGDSMVQVKAFFEELGWFDVYVQEVPLSAASNPILNLCDGESIIEQEWRTR
jgi:hypothetical protein